MANSKTRTKKVRAKKEQRQTRIKQQKVEEQQLQEEKEQQLIREKRLAEAIEAGQMHRERVAAEAAQAAFEEKALEEKALHEKDLIAQNLSEVLSNINDVRDTFDAACAALESTIPKTDTHAYAVLAAHQQHVYRYIGEAQQAKIQIEEARAEGRNFEPILTAFTKKTQAFEKEINRDLPQTPPWKKVIAATFMVVGVMLGTVIGAAVGLAIGVAAGAGWGSVIPVFGNIGAAIAGGSVGGVVGAIKGAGFGAMVAASAGAALLGIPLTAVAGMNLNAGIQREKLFSKTRDITDTLKTSVDKAVKKLPTPRVGG